MAPGPPQMFSCWLFERNSWQKKKKKKKEIGTNLHSNKFQEIQAPDNLENVYSTGIIFNKTDIDILHRNKYGKDIIYII